MNDETNKAAEVAANEPVRPVFDNEDGRSTTVPLDWPFTFKGQRYESIRLKRVTTGELSKFFDAIKNAPDGKEDSIILPVYDIDPEVFDCLDADDAEKLDRLAKSFLPRRFQVGTDTE